MYFQYSIVFYCKVRCWGSGWGCTRTCTCTCRCAGNLSLFITILFYPLVRVWDVFNSFTKINSSYQWFPAFTVVLVVFLGRVSFTSGLNQWVHRPKQTYNDLSVTFTVNKPWWGVALLMYDNNIYHLVHQPLTCRKNDCTMWLKAVDTIGNHSK